MSRGRKAKTISNGATWEEIFNKSQGFYFQYIITKLGRKTTCLTNENANDLLEKIKIEKDKLIQGKQIKLGKFQDAEIQDELLFEIPKNWVWCSLGELSISITDGTHQTPTYVEKGRPFISATHVKPFRFIPENYKFVSEKAYQECIANRKPELGDILVTRVGAIGEAAVIDVELEFAFYVSVGLIKHFKDFVYSDFLAFVINSPYGNLYSKGNVSSKGSSAGNFNLGRIRSFLIPLPPRSEQRMILEFLNDFGNNELDENREYFDSEIEKDVISLHQAQSYNNQITTELSQQLELVHQLRQAFLREAMQGKLVPQDPADEPAEILLEKIKAEKEKLVAKKKIKKEKPLPEIKPEEIPIEIPDNWTWCRLSAIANSMSTGPFGTMLHKSDYVENGIPLVNPTNIVNGKIVSSGRMMVSEKTKQRLNSYELENGDVVIARRGEMGRCAVVTENESGWLCGTGSFFISLSSFINRDFFVKVFSSDYSKSYLSGFSVGSTMDNLNHRILNSYPFPLPPLAEQKRIVEKLEKLMKYCDELEANIRESKGQAESLLQVALKEALDH